VDGRQLECFRLASEHLSFTRAAERARLTPATFSQHIRRLETALGVDLFERTTHGVRLTLAGERLLEPAKHVLDRRDALAQRAADLTAGGRGHVRVACPGFGMGELGAQVMAETRRRRPQVEISLHHPAPVEALAMLFAREVDVVVAHRVVDDPRLTWAGPCAAEPRLVGVASGSPLAQADEVTAADLARSVVVPFGEVVDGCDAWGVVPAARAVGPPAADLAALATRILAGDGVGMLPATMVHFYATPGVTFVPSLDLPMASLSVARRADDDGAASHVVQDLLDVCAAHPELGGLAPRTARQVPAR
jgi:DNA-binding transcriptional LysR family regulator